MFTKIFKIIFFFILVAALFLTVDFNDFSFKTIKPPPKTEISSDGSPKKGIRKQNPVEALPQGERKFQGSQTDIIRLANEAREGKGLSSLEENAKLSLSARKKAEHMKKNDYFDHVSPNGLQPWYFAEKVEYNYKTFGENLAEGYFSAQSVHEGWMNSPGHRENIMSEKFEEMGVAIVESSQGNRKSYLIVQHFGSPLKERFG